MTLVHVFRSGNDCFIYIPEDLQPGFVSNRVEWERYPPSDEDLKEWHEEVYPHRVVPALEALLRKKYGSGRFIEVLPGLRAWMKEPVN